VREAEPPEPARGRPEPSPRTEPKPAVASSAAGVSPAEDGEDQSQSAKPGVADSAKTIAGLIAVGIGVIVVMVIAIVAIGSNSETAGTIAGSAVAVIGSIVGAYLGVKVGTDQTAKALDQLDKAGQAQQETSKRAEVYALHVDKSDAPAITRASHG
jgi:hypothetical protein